MNNTQQTQPTLFARYKRMINEMWNDGQRKYTANELNLHVGVHERSTMWKRSNNNIFYTTRTYQTALKKLGCITMIKRGLWQINAPIPEWFGSFQLGALLNRGILNDLESHSIYWMNLPDEHKVNPWKNIDPMHVMSSINYAGNNNNKTTTMNTQVQNPSVVFTNVTLQSIQAPSSLSITLPSNIGIEFQVSACLDDNGEIAIDICDHTWLNVNDNFVNGLAIMMGDDAFKAWIRELEEQVIDTGLADEKLTSSLKATAAVSNINSGTYTKEQVIKLLQDFVGRVKTNFRDDIDSTFDGIDESDVVEIDFDSYDRRINVELRTDTFSTEAYDQLDSTIDVQLDEIIESINEDKISK